MPKEMKILLPTTKIQEVVKCKNTATSAQSGARTSVATEYCCGTKSNT